MTGQPGHELAAQPEIVRLGMGELSGSVNTQGAYLELLQFGGRDLLMSRTGLEEGGDSRDRGGVFAPYPYFGPSTAFEGFGLTDQHGLTRNRLWARADDAGIRPATARFEYQADENDGMYAGLYGSISYTLGTSDEGNPRLISSLVCVNNGQNSVPVTPGFHPYFPHIETTGKFEVSFTDGKGRSDTKTYKTAELHEAQVVGGDIAELRFVTGSRYVTMKTEGLPVPVVWSAKPGKYICVEPTSFGMVASSSAIPPEAMLAPGAQRQARMEIVWQESLS